MTQVKNDLAADARERMSMLINESLHSGRVRASTIAPERPTYQATSSANNMNGLGLGGSSGGSSGSGGGSSNNSSSSSNPSPKKGSRFTIWKKDKK